MLAALGTLLLLLALPAAAEAGWEAPAAAGPSATANEIGSVDAAEIAGVPHVAWVQDGLPFAARLTTGGSWETLAGLTTALGTAQAIAIAGDAAGVPLALVTDGDVVRAARYTGGGWTAETVPQGFSVSTQDPDLALVGGSLWLAATTTAGSAPSVVSTWERTGAGTFTPRGSPIRASFSTDRGRLAADVDGVTPVIAFREQQTGTHGQVSRFAGGTSWTPLGPVSGSVDGQPGTVARLEPAVVGGALHVALARGTTIRLLRSGAAPTDPWVPAVPDTTAAAAVTDLALRPVPTGALLASTAGAEARVAALRGGTLQALSGAAPSAAVVSDGSLGFTAPGGTPVVAVPEPSGTTQAVAARHLRPDFGTTSFTSTPSSVTLTTIAHTFGAALPIGFQRSRGAPEQVTDVVGDGFHPTATATFGGLPPDTAVPWRPVLAYGPFAFGPAEDGLARTSAAPAQPPPPGEAPAPPTPPTTTGTPPPPPPGEPDPTLGRTAAVDATRGRVVVTRPGGKPQRLGPNPGLLPIGTKVDVSQGKVELWFDTADGKGQHRGFFYQGIFRIRSQDRRTGLVTFQLDRPTRCARTRKGAARSAGKKKNKLWGDAKGRFRTRGKFAAATVRGTKWSTEDACDRTTVAVLNGTVDAQDLVRRRTTRLKAGRSYTARGR